jgi:hypothetical protein
VLPDSVCGGILNKFIARITSIRLGIGLIVYLAAASSLATFIPQGLTGEEYQARYPKLVAELVVQTGFDNFFGSILFIIPAFAFFANLSACTVKRFLRELKKKARHHHGPDVLHVGLMLLVIGSIWSFSGHKAGSVVMAPGDGVNLPDGSLLHLDDFRFERYADGRPRDWVSVVTLEKDGVKIKEKIEIRVNTPLRYKELTFYQSTYQEVPALALMGADGIEILLAQGEERVIGGETYLFMAPEGSSAGSTSMGGGSAAMGANPPSGMGSSGSAPSTRAVVRIGAGAAGKTVRLGPGEMAGALRVVGMKAQLASGLDAVSDPGYRLVFVALILIAAGTSLTFAQKLKEGV